MIQSMTYVVLFSRVKNWALTWKPPAIMTWMIELAWTGLQVTTVFSVDKEEISTVGSIEAIMLGVMAELALPSVSNVAGVMVWMLDARAADAYRIK